MKKKLLVLLTLATLFGACHKESENFVTGSRERTDPDCYNPFNETDCNSWWIDCDTNGRENYSRQFGIVYGKKISLPEIDTIQFKSGYITPFNTEGEKYYNNDSLVTAPKNYTGSSTTTSGVATFYLTTNGLSSGTAIYSSVYNVVTIINDASTNYTYGWTYTPGTKVLTVTAKYSPGLVVGLLTLLGLPQNVPNGTTVNVSVKGA